MRLLIIALLFAALNVSHVNAQAPAESPAEAPVTAPSVTETSPSYVCPQCGKVHARRVSLPAESSNVASAGRPVVVNRASQSTHRNRSRGSVSNVLATLNAQRARQGVPSLRYDSELQAVAERRARQMAASGQKDHPAGSFAPGTYEGVGWSSSFQPSGVSACYTSDSRMRYAGAAMAVGRDGVYFAVVYR